MDERVIRTEYSELMQKAYIDYAMSVIVSRALPDVRDGLKPVQRRTLYDMLELGTHFDKPYRKCARIVGDTMGKYHPHGDSSIYEALVVMAQDFKKGLPLVDGHGNFGSIEGDSAAAMRYTEARLQKITQEVYLKDMNLDVVDFIPNFDETEKEPEVLPVRIPNLLVNGSDGIAVGMATSIPPHNIAEVIDAVKAYMKNNDITIKELLKYIKGPDFPTGGEIINKDDLLDIYENGTGKLKLRGRVEIEKGKNGKQSLVITEIPYTMIGANIGKFLNDIAELVESRKASDIVDISNQSSKEGIRIVLELKKGADPEKLKNLLYKKTKLEDTFGVNMLAVANGRPETCSLKKIIEYHVDFRFELATRKYQNLLASQLEKKEVQEGLIKACDIIDLLIEIIRGSKNRQQVKECLTAGNTEGINFKKASSKKQAAGLCFTARQADAILDMRLYKLIGMEIEALQKEYDESLKKIERYEDILNNYDSMAEVIIEDLDQIKKEYWRARRTTVFNGEAAIVEEEPIQDSEVVILIDRFGYTRSVDPAVYERNKEAAESESKYIIRCMTSDKLAVFTNKGNMHTVKAAQIPFGKFRDKGTPIDNLSAYTSTDENILFIDSISHVRQNGIVFVTSSGYAKIVEGCEFDVSRRTILAAKLENENDEIILVGVSEIYDSIVTYSGQGHFLKFPLSEVPVKKKTALGVKTMKLSEGEKLEGAYLIANGIEFEIEYKGKKVLLNKLKIGSRGTKGTKIRI